MNRKFLVAIVAAGLGLTAPSAMAHGTRSLRASDVQFYGSATTGPGHVTRGSITRETTFLIPGVAHHFVFRADDSTDNCATDRSGSVNACMTENFESCQVGSINAVNVDDFTASWGDLDPGSALVQLTGGTVRAELMGISDKRKCGGGDHAHIGSQLWRVRDPAYNHVYTFRPRWAGEGYFPMSGPASSCGNTVMGVRRRRERWTVSVPDVCEGTLFNWTPVGDPRPAAPAGPTDS